MPTLDPASFSDGIAYFREFHRLILKHCAELERIMEVTSPVDAKQKQDIADLLDFFGRQCPRHERDEEELIFPILLERTPHVGFQNVDTPVRFLIEGHEKINRETAALMDAWHAVGTHDLSGNTLTRSATHHATQQSNLAATAKSLATLYRKHIAMEEEKVYQLADRILTKEDRTGLIDSLRGKYDNENLTDVTTFSAPHYSNPAYNIQYVTEATSDKELPEDSDTSDDSDE